MKTASAFLLVVIGVISVVMAYAFYVQLEIAVFLATATSTLAYVLFTYWDQHVASPRLQIFFIPSKPSEYTPQLEMFDQIGQHIGPFRFIRVVIQNCGSRPAHGCVGQVKLLGRPAGCSMFSEEPKTLKWVDIPRDDYIPPKGGKAVLGVAFSMRDIRPTIDGNRCAVQKRPQTTVNALALTPEALANPQIRAQDAFCAGAFKIRVTVYCAEASPASKDFILEVDEDWQKLNMRPRI